MRVVIEPVAVLRKGFTETALGEAILAALERSRTAPPVPKVDKGAGRFWQVTGIRGFGAFSRKFQCVDLQETRPLSGGLQIDSGVGRRVCLAREPASSGDSRRYSCGSDGGGNLVPVLPRPGDPRQ